MLTAQTDNCDPPPLPCRPHKQVSVLGLEFSSLSLSLQGFTRARPGLEQSMSLPEALQEAAVHTTQSISFKAKNRCTARSISKVPIPGKEAITVT